MKFIFNTCIITLCFIFASQAQINEKTLFKIDGEPYKVDSFINSYTKNLDHTTSKSGEGLEDYLELYINFHLKLKSAYQQKLDTLPSFQNEFQSYYKQIADNYISNGEVTESMVSEAYDRIKTEVKASHVLLNLSNDEDTLEVYNKALMIKEKAEKGENFEALAKTYSQDPSVKQNAGDMGWFNSFKMVYEFEDAVYQLDIGEISEPVKSEFGYHIIKKTGERPSKGKLSTAHIILMNGDSLQQPPEQIQKIYEKLNKGENFHDLAKQYSQDKNSAESGGYLTPFSLGDINSKVFENEVFKLDNEGDYTKPFQTKFGWHIVKLIKVEPIKDYKEIKDDLKRKIKTSSRSKLLISKIKDDLKKRYTLKINPQAKSYFINALDSTYQKGEWEFEPEDGFFKDYVLKVENQSVNYETFGEYLKKQYRSLSQLQDFQSIVDKAIDELSYSQLLTFHKANLPKIDNEFKKKIDEYKQGILIFDFMKANVWDAVSKDSLSQQAYYEAHKKEFKKGLQIKGQLYTSKSKTELEKLRSQLKNQTLSDSLVIPENVISEEVFLSKKTSKLPKKFKLKVGISSIYKHLDQFLLMKVDAIEPSRIMRFNEVKGKVISQLQDQKEEKITSVLRSEYPVEINKNVLRTLKDKFEN